MFVQKLKWAAKKIMKANRGKWRTLSTGEKVLKVIIILLKLALIVFCGAAIFAIILGVWIAFSLMGGIVDAVNGQIWRSHVYRNRRRYYW